MTIDRRQALRLAAFAALAPLVAPRPARALALPNFSPPIAPMRYTRVLARTMADGASFIVSRSFAVRFAAAGRGYRLEGEQVDVSVEAPAKLEKFASIERERREVGLFPLALDHEGHIFGARAAVDSTALEAAVREATQAFTRTALRGDEREEISRFVTALHQNAARLVTELPADLFAPVDADRATTREVSLPEGESGTVTVSFTATADPLTGLMQQARREVITALSTDRRKTIETWRLEPLQT